MEGWRLVEQPGSAAAQHVLEWIAGLAAGGAEVRLIHPEGELPELPAGISAHPIRRRAGKWSRFHYDQVGLPRAAAEAGAELLLILDERVPLRTRMPVAAVPPIGPPRRAARGVESLRRAAGQAGLRGAAAVLFAEDIAGQPRPGRSYPPFVPESLLRVGAGPAVAERRWVLCYDTNPEDARNALAAWTWVDGSLGDTYPLMFVSEEAEVRKRIAAAAADLDVAESVKLKEPTVQTDELYREAAALLSVSPVAWGQPYRWALAAGVPIAAFESAAANSILEDAGYLVGAGDTRSLGAACLSLLVQEDLAESLRVKGRRRASTYRTQPPIELLAELATGRGRADRSAMQGSGTRE